jgi:signal peptidase II
MQESINPRNIIPAKTRVIFLSLFIALGFLLDRILKYIVETRLPNEELFIVPKIFSVLLHQNHGMAFSISVPMWLIITAGAIMLAVLGFYAAHSLKIKRLDWYWPLGLIFVGGLSNLFDRISYGYTIDYLHLYPYSFFNIADLLIIIGCALAIANNFNKKQNGNQ